MIMAKTILLRLAVPLVIIGALAPWVALEAQPERVVQDSTRPEPFVIAVLADNFTAAEVDDFNEIVDNLFTYGLLATDPFLANRAAFRVVSVFYPESSHSAPSRYGFTLETDPASNCSVSWEDYNTDRQVFEDQSTVPDAQYAVVVGNYNYTFGCRHGSWAYIAKGSVGHPIIEHEIGHLVFGLLDEFSLAKNVNVSYPTPPVRPYVNCSTDVRNPYWLNNPDFKGARVVPHCDLFGLGIVHAYDDCKMGAHGRTFCPVCQKILTTEMGCVLGNESCDTDVALRSSGFGTVGAGLLLATAATPAPTSEPVQPAKSADRPMLRLLLAVNSAPDSPVAVLSAIDSKGRAGNRERRVGDYVYEVTDGQSTLALGVLPGHPFEARSYRGGLTEHAANTQSTASIVVAIPGETRETVRRANRDVRVTFYRLSPELSATRITSGLMQKLRGTPMLQRHAQLTGQQLRDGIEQLKQ
jgi:hypothetical protein